VSADALPGLAAAEHAERAILNLDGIGALQGDRRVVVAAAVRIVNPAAPFRAFRFHVDQDLLAGLLDIAAEIGAAFFDANVAFILLFSSVAQTPSGVVGAGAAATGAGCGAGVATAAGVDVRHGEGG
jgi:hypothetical protein